MVWPVSALGQCQGEKMTDQWGYLVYLVLLLVVVGSMFVGRDRLKLGNAVRIMLIWVFIFGVVTLGYVAFNS